MTSQILPQNTTACNGQTNRKQRQIIVAFDNLYTHGDETAAALALGDLWLTLPPVDRIAVVVVMKELAGVNFEPGSDNQKMSLIDQQALTTEFGGWQWPQNS